MEIVTDNLKLPLVIYHANCLDGFTSAWIAWRFAKNYEITPEFHPGVYQEKNLPDVAGRAVIMVDFSYPAEVIEEMGKVAASILILDHHKSAELALQKWIKPFTNEPPGPGEVVAHFDQELSGAGLCWKYFFGDEPVPKLVESVQDRDLWRFQEPGTREICAVLYAHEFDFDLWDHMAVALETAQGFERMAAQGEVLLHAQKKDRNQLKTIARTMVIGGWPMPVVNAPWFHASDLGNELAQAAPGRVAATYHDEADGRRKFSLRSVPGGPDVAEIAAKLGGGGHMRAAGFMAPANWSGDNT